MPTPLGDVIDSMRAAVQGESWGWLATASVHVMVANAVSTATLFEEPERGIGFAPDVLYHRADARPPVKRRTADLEVKVVRDISMERKRAVTAALTVRGDMAPYRFEGCGPVRFALENRR